MVVTVKRRREIYQVKAAIRQAKILLIKAAHDGDEHRRRCHTRTLVCLYDRMDELLDKECTSQYSSTRKEGNDQGA